MPEVNANTPVGATADIPSARLTTPDFSVPAATAPPPSLAMTLTSRVGTGTIALTTILLVLMTGGWYFGKRLVLHLIDQRNHHA